MRFRSGVAAILVWTFLAPQHIGTAQESQPAPSAAQATAANPTEASRRIEKVRADAVARRHARRVRVLLTDGTLVTGRVVGVMDNDMVVQPTPSDEPVLLQFDNIESIDGPGLPRWARTALAVGAAAAAVVVISALRD